MVTKIPPNQITPANAGKRIQFRFADHVIGSGWRSFFRDAVAMNRLRNRAVKPASWAFSLKLLLMAASSLLAGIRVFGETSLVFEATKEQVGAAITNAFDLGRYYEMILGEAEYQIAAKARKWSRQIATNEWYLAPSMLPIAFVPRRNKTAPYSAEFDIRARQISTNQCKVGVTTMESHIWEGKGVSIHGVAGPVAKTVPACLTVETNVLLEIKTALTAIQNGDNKPLPPTFERKSASQDELLRVKKYNPNYEKMLRRTLVTNTTASGK